MLVEGIPASPSPSRHPTHSVTRSHSHSQTKTGTSTATGTRTRSPSPTPATTIVIDMFPARLTLGSIKGHVEHLGNPTAYKVALYLQADNGLWWSKPHPGDTVTLDAAGRFDYENWYVSPPTDYKFINLRFMVFPVGATVPSVLGVATIPTTPTPIADATFPRGYQPPGGIFFVMTSFPVPGGLSPVAGQIMNLADPTAYEVVMYVEASDGGWWTKPQPYSALQLSATGSFSIDWASSPSTDIAILSIQLYILPVGAGIAPAAGWPLPLYANYIVQARFERGYVISRRMLSAVEENESNTVQAAALRGQA
jgi:hypothetical protein